MGLLRLLLALLLLLDWDDTAKLEADLELLRLLARTDAEATDPEEASRTISLALLTEEERTEFDAELPVTAW